MVSASDVLTGLEHKSALAGTHGDNLRVAYLRGFLRNSC